MQDENLTHSQQVLRYLQLVVLIYGLLVAFSVHTSHTSMFKGAANERSHILFGAPRPERSDEFLRGSPLQIGQLRGATALDRTPLEFSNSQAYQKSQRSFASQLLKIFRTPEVHLDSLLSAILPIQNAFIAKWWILDFLFFISFPLFLIKLRQPLTSSVLISVAVFFCPPNVWFSYLPSRLVGLCAASVVCYAAALDPPARVRKSHVGHFVFVGVMSIWAARYLVSVVMYPPWGFPIAGVMLSAFLVWILRSNSVRYMLHQLIGTVVTSVVIVVLTVISNRTLYKLALSTVYPGSRRSTGGSDSSPFLGGFVSWFMQADSSRKGGFTNPEFAYGPTPLIVVIVALIVICSSQIDLRARARGLIIPTAVFAIVALWSQINFPKLFHSFNPLVLVPAGRASMILGVLVLVLLGLSSHLLLFTSKLNIAATGAIIVLAWMVAASDSEDRRLLTLGAPSPWITLISLASAGFAIWWLVRGRSVLSRFVPITLTMVCSGILVNPIVIGVGPIAKSSAIQTIRELAREAPGMRFASTGFYEDALLIASAVPQLSGQQVLAPNVPKWELLDKEGRFKDFWNRGQSYISFVWSPGTPMNIWNPSPDVIQIVIDPCDQRLGSLSLGFVVSPSPISTACLTEVKVLKWMTSDLFVYKRATTL